MGGIVVLGAARVQIDGGTVSGFNDGIILYGTNNAVRGTKVKDSCVFGIVVSGQGNTLDKNVVTGAGTDGVALGVATNTAIVSNYISGNLRAAIGISNFSNNNVVANNVVNDNFGGIDLNSLNNIAYANRVDGNTSTGISIGGVGAPSILWQNVVFGSGTSDMSDATPACAGNTWGQNNFLTDLVSGTEDGGPGTGCIR